MGLRWVGRYYSLLIWKIAPQNTAVDDRNSKYISMLHEYENIGESDGVTITSYETLVRRNFKQMPRHTKSS
jgi:hypothetical protein